MTCLCCSCTIYTCTHCNIWENDTHREEKNAWLPLQYLGRREIDPDRVEDWHDHKGHPGLHGFREGEELLCSQLRRMASTRWTRPGRGGGGGGGRGGAWCRGGGARRLKLLTHQLLRTAMNIIILIFAIGLLMKVNVAWGKETRGKYLLLAMIEGSILFT